MTEVRNVAAPEEPDRLRTMAASSEGFVDPEYLIDSDWLACHLDDPGCVSSTAPCTSCSSPRSRSTRANPTSCVRTFPARNS